MCRGPILRPSPQAIYCGKNCNAMAGYRRAHGVSELEPACLQCGAALTPGARGTKPRYCSAACRSSAAYGRYKADGRLAAWSARSRRIRQGVYADPDSERFPPTEVFDRDGWTCWLCDEQVVADAPRFHPLSPSLDHILPISHGGLHTRANVKCAHLRCNIVRGNQTRARNAVS